MTLHYDLCVIGGGINGAGIARDAAGRGLSVLLLEAGDLAQATSSSSTKLIHGGLRYLEHYAFRLVRDSLNERERLLNSAPHIIWPLEFILPHEPHLRPAWLIRMGLFLYDHLSTRQTLPSSESVKFATHKAGAPLKEDYKKGFSYADCWVEDARLVVLNAMDAAEKGATIKPRSRCVSLVPSSNKELWEIATEKDIFHAKCVVNAAGPWAYMLLEANNLALETTHSIRAIKGSHVVIPKLYEGTHAYILQQPDGRIVFTIPYEQNYTLIGTTDEVHDDDPGTAKISNDEISYLCAAVNRSFVKQITVDDITWTYSGVRALVDSGGDNASKLTRDYVLDLETSFGPPLLNILGGKLTTFRKLSEQAVDKLTPFFPSIGPKWTKTGVLPGGDIEGSDFEVFVQQQKQRYKNLDPNVLYRLVRAYGTRMDILLENGPGDHYGDGIYEAEIRYLVKHEWARTCDDILWRRSKLGLHIQDKTKARIEKALEQILKG